MPFVRFSRDKRGYQHVYLVHTSGGKRGKPSPSRVLYWFRTPPDVKVGREAFDETTRRLLESQYPNLTFEWERIINTPMPTPEPEPWRERRRAERLARHTRADEERDLEMTDSESRGAEGIAEPPPEPEAPAPGPIAAGETAALGSIVSPARSASAAAGRRRRRRAGRGRSRPQPTIAAETPPDAPGPSTLGRHEEE